MGYLKERVAYLRGMAEGMQLSESTNEGKMLKAILEVMDDFALAVDDIEEVQEELSEQVDTIDEDLAEVEKALFDEDEDEDECDCEEETEFTTISCPYCNEEIEVEAGMIDTENSKLECPACHKKIDVEWECECGSCSDHDDKE